MAEDKQLKDFSECLAGLLGDEVTPEFVESVLLSGERESKQKLEEQWSMPAVDSSNER